METEFGFVVFANSAGGLFILVDTVRDGSVSGSASVGTYANLATVNTYTKFPSTPCTCPARRGKSFFRPKIRPLYFHRRRKSLSSVDSSHDGCTGCLDAFRRYNLGSNDSTAGEFPIPLLVSPYVSASVRPLRRRVRSSCPNLLIQFVFI